MTRFEDLVLLVKTLQKEEKKSLTQWIGEDKKNKKYAILLAEIQKHIQQANDSEVASEKFMPDEPRLKATLKRKGIAEHLPNLTDYLYQVILKKLRNLHEEDLYEDKIRVLHQEAKILIKKGHFTAAVEKLEDALTITEDFEYYSAASQVLKDLVYVKGQIDSKAYIKTILQYVEKIQSFSGLERDELQFFSLHYQAFLLLRSGENAADKTTTETIQKIHRQLDSLGEPQTFLSKLYHQHIQASISSIQKDYSNAKNCHLNILKIWEEDKYKLMKTERLRLYIVYLFNYLNYCIVFKDYPDFEKYKKLLYLAEKQTIQFDDKAEAFQNIIFLENLYYMNIGQLEEAIELMEKNKVNFIRYKEKINIARLFTLYFNTMIACFALGNYNKASDWSKNIFELGKSEQKKDIQTNNQIFQIILRFEMISHPKEYEILVVQINNLIERLKYANRYFAYEALMLKNILGIVRTSAIHKQADHPYLKQQFQKFADAIQLYRKEEAGSYIAGLDEILFWVQSKVTNTSFRDQLIKFASR